MFGARCHYRLNGELGKASERNSREFKPIRALQAVPSRPGNDGVQARNFGFRELRIADFKEPRAKSGNEFRIANCGLAKAAGNRSTKSDFSLCYNFRHGRASTF